MYSITVARQKQAESWGFTSNNQLRQIMGDLRQRMVSVPVSCSRKVFSVSFFCSGEKAGEVDMSFYLNYTIVYSGLVETGQTRMFVIVARRRCLKTDGSDDNDDDKGVINREVTSWSRGMIVGLCTGLALFVILVVGLALWWRYIWRQRKLKMEFEDDSEMDHSSSSHYYKKMREDEEVLGQQSGRLVAGKKV